MSQLPGKNLIWVTNLCVVGGSSGIGLAAIKLLDVGASVVTGDLNFVPLEHANLAFVKADVTKWYDLKALFKHAKQPHGQIDHVFTNAGISNRANYL